MTNVINLDERRKAAAQPAKPMSPAKLPVVERFDLFNDMRAHQDAVLVEAHTMDCELLHVLANQAATHIFVSLGHTPTTYRVTTLRASIQDWPLDKLIAMFGFSSERDWTAQPFDFGALALELRTRIPQAITVLALKHNA